MTSTYQHRVILICPANRVVAMRTFWSAQIDAGQGLNTWSVGLNATGDPNDPITAYWISCALQPADLAKIVARLCTLATAAGTTITVPSDWNTYTKAQIVTWLGQNLGPILSATGIKVVRSDNDGDWDSADDALAALGLKRISAVLG